MCFQSIFAILLSISSFSGESYCFETSSTFTDVKGSPGFVDKSMLIKYFLESKRSNLVITAPGDFGKSTNIDMLRTFLEIPMTADDDGGHEDKFKREETEKLFKLSRDLLIRQAFSTVEEHFMKYPVIHFDFKDINVASYDAFKDSFTEMVRVEYTRHEYLYANASESEKELYDTGLFPEKKGVDEMVGQLLSRMLHDFHNKSCIVLIDEYETPLVLSLLHQQLPESYVVDIVKFIGYFIGNLTESNRYVTRSLFTGDTKIGSIYKEYAKSLEFVSIFDDENVSNYYGFSETDLIRLARVFGKEDKVDEIRFWYDGFQVRGGCKRIYCPVSVLGYLEDGEFHSYWAKSLFPLQNAFDINNEFCRKIENTIYNVTIVNFDEKLDVNALVKLKYFLHYGRTNCLDDKLMSLMLQYLTEYGVYTVQKDVTDTKKEIAVTNHDTRRQLKKVLYSLNYLEKRVKLKYKDADDYLQSLKKLTENNAHIFKEFLCKVNALLCKCSVNNKNDMFLVLYYSIVNDKDGVRRFHWYYDSEFPVLVTASNEKIVQRGARKQYTTLDILVIDDENACFIMELTYEKESSLWALKQIFLKQLYKAFERMPYKAMCQNKNKIYMGIHHNPKTSSTSMSYLFSDENINNAVNLSI